MSKKVTVSFPGGKKVDGHFKGLVVKTDQPIEQGGEGTAPSPFDLFWISLATCSGFYALEFCQSRQLPTEGLGVELIAERNEQEKRFDKVRVEVKLPTGFPEKYREALKRAVEFCTVKKHVLQAPEFETVLI
jgi:putative redox protein